MNLQQKIKVVILCGGKGSRLREYTKDIPKALVEIGGKPILWHIMKHYAHHGFRSFILCLGYKGEMVEEYFKKRSENFDIQFVNTGLESNKAERLLKIREFIEEDIFLATYGDSVSNVSINRLLDLYHTSGRIAVMTAVPLFTDCAIVDVDEGNEVRGFRDRPALEGYWTNGGFFVFNKKIYNYLREDEELEDKCFTALANERQIIALKFNGFWKCMNTLKECLELNELWGRGEAGWKVW